ncbi:MraY family glycosyltransferase [Sphingobacterium ginsenosidimutans]|uniref:MraY family glycosyltransferase n=1 Tax=Sphingobacterium ginsenosidimutans TaxID=687845 RepID=A0ABP7ZQQ2_9SPHI
MNFLVVFIPFAFAIILGRIMFPFILLVSYRKRLFDPIDERKLHQRIIPRLGGVAFAPIQCCLLVLTLVVIFKLTSINLHVESWAILPSLMVLVCGLFILYVVGLGDDLVGVDYKWKFLIQICVASLFPLSGLWINDCYGLFFIGSLSPWIGFPITIFIVVLIINAINLMDGLDGLCSGVVGVGCLFLGTLFLLERAWLHALFAFITTGVLIPFFYYNVFGTSRRKRQIFMGDTGSMTLGFSMSFLAISFAMNNHFIKPFSLGAITVACSTLIIPVFDVARVVYVRWRIGKPLFKPDRNHLHHKLLRMGLSRKATLLTILFLTLFFPVINCFLVKYVDSNIVVGCDILLWLGVHLSFNLEEKRRGKIKSKSYLTTKLHI